MAKYKLIVFSDAVPGRDDDYNNWYNNKHLQVVAVPGFVSAQRFKLNTPMLGEFDTRYMAIYGIETENVDITMAEMSARAGTDQMVMTDAMDMGSTTAGFFEACSKQVFAHH